MPKSSKSSHPRLLFSLIWIATLAAGIVAAGLLVMRVLQPTALPAPEPSMQRLQPIFAGETLLIPEQPGIWLQTLKQATVLINLAHPVGSSQFIDLCVQQTRSQHEPQAIFEIVLAGDWADLQAAQAARLAAGSRLRRPLLLPTAFKAGLPGLVIAGLAANTLEASNLSLRTIRQTNSDDWRLLSDSGKNQLAATKIAFTQEAWLIWRTPHALPDGGFQHALRIKRQMPTNSAFVTAATAATPTPSTACGAGQLELSLYAVSNGTPQPHGLAIAVSTFPNMGGVMHTRMTAGKYLFPQQPFAKLEDQALFEAALQHGLIRRKADGRLELAPPDLRLAQKAGVQVATWQHIDTSQPVVARLLRRLYLKQDGEFVRSQIRRFNAALAQNALPLTANAAQLGQPSQPPDAGFQHIQANANTINWVAASPVPAQLPPAEVSVSARDGSMLYQKGAFTASAQALGLSTLVGIAPQHSSSVAGVLARLNQHGVMRVDARLSIDPVLQGLAQKILACNAMQGGQWQIQENRCSSAQSGSAVVGRRTGMIVLDADSGEILVAAGEATPDTENSTPTSDTPQTWWQQELQNTAHSPLRITSLQHDNGPENNPGSSFKLVTALGLELAASQNAMLDAMLAGQTPAEINKIGQAIAFRMDSACYPQACSGKATDIINFKQHLPQEYVNGKGQFGLREALSSSTNTWFSWLTEVSDQTTSTATLDAVPLGPGSLNQARPVWAMAHKLGFERSMKLDGGLLPPDFRWQTWDALRATPSNFDYVLDRPQIRWYGIGSRMHVTALQMAVVAGSIGTGKVVQPKLLQTLNGKAAQTSEGEPVGVRLDRIRAGMKAVTETGTAKTAFADPALATMRTGIYGKTGTIPRGQGDARGVNTGWFVGYVEPGTLPRETRRLAFAVFVSRTQETGGGGAARVVVDWVGALIMSR